MGFEQLAELRDRLRAEKEPQKADSAEQPTQWLVLDQLLVEKPT